MWHEESTPSLVQYGSHWKCFGSCNKTYTNSEVETKAGQTFDYEELEYEKEDLHETFGYIKSLRRIEHRGLSFPADERGYYLCWPGDAYYKYRQFDPAARAKYLGPSGHKPPLFWARKKGVRTLCIVEGEINALSVSEAYNQWDVCSPGSATMFNADNLSKYLTEFKLYSNIVVILDNDPAGIKGLIEAKAYLLYKMPFVSFHLMSPDANEVLCNGGKEALRTALSRQNPK